MTTEHTPNKEMPNREGRPVAERSGAAAQTSSSGVSDIRRAQLARMEADAGTQHEAADESVRQRQPSPAITRDPTSGAPSPGSMNRDD